MNNREVAYALMRITYGVIFLFYGIGKFMGGLFNFVGGMNVRFHRHFLSLHETDALHSDCKGDVGHLKTRKAI